MATPTKLVIDRKRWLRGEGVGELLRVDDGKMCCLGFFALACGTPPEIISNRVEPQYCPDVDWPDWLLSDDDGEALNTAECGRLIESNDSESLAAAERESTIARIFAKHGVEVTFVDEPPPPSTPKEK